MPTERLHVQNFAGIEEAEIELSRITVLIGPQASGKSICAKLLFYFKEAVRRIASGVAEGRSPAQIRADDRKLFLTYFPSASWSTGSFTIRYSYGDFSIMVRRKDGRSSTIEIAVSRDYHQLVRYARRVLKALRDPRQASFQSQPPGLELREKLREETTQSLGPSLSNQNYFIPAGRSFFSTLQSNVFSILASNPGNAGIDPFLVEFGRTYENLRWLYIYFGMHEEELEDHLDRRARRLLRGTFVHVQNEDFIDTLDGRRVPLTHSSSGQQEVLPLMVTLRCVTQLPQIALHSTFLVEEPEAHLHPSAQRDIVHLFTEVADFSSANSTSQYVITTHSPYILSAINNLVYGGKIAHDTPENRSSVMEVLGGSVLVDPSHMSAYYMDEGTARSIVDPETGLIEATVLDQVSGEMARDFEALMDIEFGEG